MQFLKIYRRVKDVFVKPKIKWYFGSWKNEPNLPVWRCGPTINLTKDIGRHKIHYKAYYPNNKVQVFEGYSDHEWNGKKIKKYSWSNHILPGKLNEYKPVWNRIIRKKLRKLHLSWIPPVIQLPIWLSFHFFDHDITYKSKWNQWRYEYPAHITLVLFGFAISVTAVIPYDEFSTVDMDYWESLLTYIDKPNLDDLNDEMGWWSGETLKHWRLRPEFLKEPYKTQLITIQNEINEKRVDKIS